MMCQGSRLKVRACVCVCGSLAHVSRACEDFERIVVWNTEMRRYWRRIATLEYTLYSKNPSGTSSGALGSTGPFVRPEFIAILQQAVPRTALCSNDAACACGPANQNPAGVMTYESHAGL
eukprot:5645252-Prymnesium_polylepis.1